MNNFTLSAETCQTLNVKSLQLINFILHAAKKNFPMHASQAYLGKKIGCTREWCNKLLKNLEEIGIITSIYRHRHTKIYLPSKIFKNQEFRYRMNVLLQPEIEKLYIAGKVLKTALFTPLNIKLINLKEDGYVNDLRVRIREGISAVTRSLTGRIPSNHIKTEKKERFWRKVVKINHAQWYSEAIDKINKQAKLKLTQAGKNELCKFPAESLDYGFKKYNQKEVFKDPFVYLCKLIWEDIKAKGLNINKDISERLHEQFGTKANDLLIDKQSIKDKKECRSEAYNRYEKREYIVPDHLKPVITEVDRQNGLSWAAKWGFTNPFMGK